MVPGVVSAFREAIGQERQKQSQPNAFYQKNMNMSRNFCNGLSLGHPETQGHGQRHGKTEKEIFSAVAKKTGPCEEGRRLDCVSTHKHVIYFTLDC